MKQHFIILSLALAFSWFAQKSMAGDSASSALQSAGALEFGKGNVLFVGDSKAATVHAFELRNSDLTLQTGVDYGNNRNFEGRNLIERVDEKLAAFLSTAADQISINDMVVHQPTGQILMSVSRGVPRYTPNPSRAASSTTRAT